jgi:hypothetical protein
MEYLTAPKKESYKNITLKILSGVGAIAVIAGIIWVGARGVRLFPNVGDALATAFGSVQSIFIPAERIVVTTVDSQVVINQPFSLTWEHRGKTGDGSYSFSYACSDDIHLVRRQNGVDTTLFCNTPIALLSDETTLSLTAVGTTTGFSDVPVAIRFLRNGQSVPSLIGTHTLVVQSQYLDTATSTTAVVPSTPATTTSPVAGGTPPTPTVLVPVITQPHSDPNGKADLIGNVIAYGLIDDSTGVFTATDTIPFDLPPHTRAAIRFAIVNIKTKKNNT